MVCSLFPSSVQDSLEVERWLPLPLEEALSGPHTDNHSGVFWGNLGVASSFLDHPKVPWQAGGGRVKLWMLCAF